MIEMTLSSRHRCLVEAYITPCQIILKRNAHPAITRRWFNVGLMLVQRRRLWDNITPELVQRLVFAGKILTQLTRGIDPMLF